MEELGLDLDDGSSQDFNLLRFLCYDKDGNPHEMEELGLDLGGPPADQNQANPQEARQLSMEKCIQSLVHVCQCRDANCILPSCQKVKSVVQHTKICKITVKGDCPICKQLIALCCYHAKRCQLKETECPVPFCQDIKRKMEQQQLQAQLKQAQLLSRRMAVMNTQESAAVMGTTATASGTPEAVVKPPLTAPGLPHQPGIGLKPGTETPPANVLQVQEEASHQQAPHASAGYVGKVNPAVPQVMPPLPGPTSDPNPLLSMDQCPNRY